LVEDTCIENQTKTEEMQVSRNLQSPGNWQQSWSNKSCCCYQTKGCFSTAEL